MSQIKNPAFLGQGFEGFETRQVGLEPTTFPLTAGCSTIELLSKMAAARGRLDNLTVGSIESRLNESAAGEFAAGEFW
jgi:hypothetical protein